MTSYSFSLICVNLPSQHFQASVAGETCGTITGDPITPAVVEPYLWWPSGVGKATPNLLEATTEVDILDVCLSALQTEFLVHITQTV